MSMVVIPLESGGLVPTVPPALEGVMASNPSPPRDEDWAGVLRSIAQTRDRLAFAGLFEHFAPWVKSYMRRLGADDGRAEDLTQEVMLTVWRRAGLYDERQAAVSTWIFTIARNKRIDLIRRERRPEIDLDDPTLAGEPEPEAEQLISHAQSARRLREAIDDLPSEQAAVLRESFSEDKAHSVIAEELGLPLGTVKSRVRLALTKLRQALQEME